MPNKLKIIPVVCLLAQLPLQARAAVPTDLGPGILRFANELGLESVVHKLAPGWTSQDSDTNKEYSHSGNKENAWETNWGQYFKTDIAARFNPDITARMFVEAQGNYADRYWRPININNYKDNKDSHVILREAEARIDRPTWFLHGFSGVAHTDWQEIGDMFGLYPDSFPENDWLGSSGFFGVYPSRFNQNTYLNMSHRNIPQGFEGGGHTDMFDASVAYGQELQWGYGKSGYGRLRAKLGPTKLTFTVKNEDVPYEILGRDTRKEAYALAWAIPFEAGHKIETGLLYSPYLAGTPYLVEDEVSVGSGLLGTSHSITQKTSSKQDGLGERLLVEVRPVIGNKLWIGAVDLTNLGILAGNKQQIDLSVGTDLSSSFRFDTQYTYRRPLEGPLPFLYEGTSDNIGAVASSPRGPESPFHVDWTNREAVFWTTTFWFDPSPGSQMFKNDPRRLEGWNVNKEEPSPFTMSVQYRMKDYRTTTDRQYYYNEKGEIVWEAPGSNGAWATRHPLSEGKILGTGRMDLWRWVLGFSGGQALAGSGTAYTLDTSQSKPISDYYAVEGRVERWPFAVWGHYGTGIWGPESNIHPFFGSVFDRLWGWGLSYSITVHTNLDVTYLSARSDATMYTAPDLGSYDEIRMVFSHRFGFELQFQEQ